MGNDFQNNVYIHIQAHACMLLIKTEFTNKQPTVALFKFINDRYSDYYNNNESTRFTLETHNKEVSLETDIAVFVLTRHQDTNFVNLVRYFIPNDCDFISRSKGPTVSPVHSDKILKLHYCSCPTALICCCCFI